MTAAALLFPILSSTNSCSLMADQSARSRQLVCNKGRTRRRGGGRAEQQSARRPRRRNGRRHLD